MADQTVTAVLADSPPLTPYEAHRRARAEFDRLRKAAEADQAKIERSKAMREGAELQAKRLGVPFDPDLAPPVYEGDAALHKRLHAVHYELARAEAAVAAEAEALLG